MDIYTQKLHTPGSLDWYRDWDGQQLSDLKQHRTHAIQLIHKEQAFDLIKNSGLKHDEKIVYSSYRNDGTEKMYLTELTSLEYQLLSTTQSRPSLSTQFYLIPSGSQFDYKIFNKAFERPNELSQPLKEGASWNQEEIWLLLSSRWWSESFHTLP